MVDSQKTSGSEVPLVSFKHALIPPRFLVEIEDPGMVESVERNDQIHPNAAYLSLGPRNGLLQLQGNTGTIVLNDPPCALRIVCDGIERLRVRSGVSGIYAVTLQDNPRTV